MNTKKTKILLIVALILMLFPGTAFTQENPPGENKIKDLPYDLTLDLAATSLAASGWIIMMAGKNQLAPGSCRWCEVDSFDKWGHDNIKWSNMGAANAAVYVTGFGLAPLAAFGLDALAANYDGNISGFWVDALLIAEASSLACFTAEIVKFSTGRQRPYAHFGNGSGKPGENISFYSGHTTLAFSLAVASGTVASMREYKLAPVVWGTGMAIAATTGYLSIAADRHYLTDVITAAAVGSAFGFGIPYIFHRPREKNASHISLSAALFSGGSLLMANGSW